MEIRDLETFIEVAKTQNFTKAGRILGYSQSNVSAQIQKIEDEIGKKLFDRIARGVTLNQYGSEILPYAERIVDLSREFRNFMRDEKEMEGTLRIGGCESLLSDGSEEIFARYNRRFPRIRLNLTVDAATTLLEKVYNNEIDIALIIDGRINARAFRCSYDVEEEILFVTRKSNPLLQMERVTLGDLDQEKFVMMEEDCSYVRKLKQLFEKNGGWERPFLTLQNPRIACKLLRYDDYISFLPAYSVRKGLAEGELGIIHVEDVRVTQQIQVITHGGRVLSLPMQGFLEETAGVLGEIHRAGKKASRMNEPV